MRQNWVVMLCIGSAALLSACDKSAKPEVDRAVENLNVIDESNLNDIMLTVGDPNEAVSYFARAAKDQPDRIDLQRGLAKSLIRAKRSTEAAVAWKKVIEHPDASNDDRVDYADALIRNSDWDRGETATRHDPADLRILPTLPAGSHGRRQQPRMEARRQLL